MTRFDIIGFSIFGIICMLFFGSMIYEQLCFKTYYEYINIENNKGIAEKCSIARSNMYCELEDGTYILVKQYKQITERK
jgi:hypothetical protein